MSDSQLVRLREVMDRLRSPGGCMWDAEQTHESLLKYLLEESYEYIEAVEENDREAMQEELGDVLLQVFFHSRMAEEDPTQPFTIEDVAQSVADKLIRRHPHVFADVQVTSSAFGKLGSDQSRRKGTYICYRWRTHGPTFAGLGFKVVVPSRKI